MTRKVGVIAASFPGPGPGKGSNAPASGQQAWAAHDVVQTDPLPAENPLSQAANLVFGPHDARYSEVAVERLQSLVAEKITRALTGQGIDKPLSGSTA